MVGDAASGSRAKSVSTACGSLRHRVPPLPRTRRPLLPALLSPDTASHPDPRPTHQPLQNGGALSLHAVTSGLPTGSWEEAPRGDSHSERPCCPRG